MFKGLMFAAALILGVPNAYPAPIIRYVQIEGNIRIPAASILAHVSAMPNESLDYTSIREDLKRLHNLGIFENLKVIGRSAESGHIDLVYQVREYPLIRDFSIKGVDESLEKRIREHLRKTKLELHPTTSFDPSFANKAALTVRDFLINRKYPNATVQISTEKLGNTVHVLLCIVTGSRLEVGAVGFLGNDCIPDNELISQMQYARPAPFWARWSGAARLVPEELDSDLERIRLYYMSNGYAAISVGKPRIFAVNVNGKQKLQVEIPVVEGARYNLVSLRIEGDAGIGFTDVQKIINTVEIPGKYDHSLLESIKRKITDLLGHHGYAMARVQLKLSLNEIDRTVEAVYKLDPGEPVAVGRIEFQDNRRIPDKFLRRELQLGEGELFDLKKLDKSVERLNKSNLVNKIFRSDVALKMNAKTNLLDITFRVKEKDRQGIYLTGGSGRNAGGHLGILYTAFNLMRLGETLSLQLDRGAAQSNMLLNIVGSRFLGSPFTLALSVFNTATGFNAASIVPGPDDLVEIFRRRSTGARLSGAYQLTTDLQVGLGFEVKGVSITGLQTIDSVPERSVKSELTPFILLDRTKGSGLEMRGFRARISQAWDGSLFLRSLNSTRETAQLAYCVQDPWTRRNSFAFRFQSGHVRPLGDQRLSLERRFYPGNEIVRGFNQGSLTPWATVSGDSGPALRAAGADTVLGFSVEYRVPIHGALSSLGFFDLGWAHLNQKHTAELGTGARLIEKANGAMRSSLGGELRLQLPVIRQPARFIFSWNPLRLSTLFTDSASAVHLAEPLTSLRFALGVPGI